MISLTGRIITPTGILDGAICIEDGIITKVGPELPTGVKKTDLGNAFIVPGFIDLHMHGLHRFLIDNGPENLAEICRILPRYGVTGFLPTVAPLPKGEDSGFLKILANVFSEGAAIFGFHLEGPFLKLLGALPPEALGKADHERVSALIEAAKPYPAVFSISPDFENIMDLIPIMAADNTPVFMTHTAANVEQTQAAIEAGVRHATHFYDVFPCPAETDPGVRPCGAVEAILADDRVSVDFILDGVHVNPVAVRMALACKSPDGVCLITDSNVGAGLQPGRYIFGKSGEIEMKFEGGPARLTENNNMPGGLAGSGLTMDRALRNAVDIPGVDLVQAIRMVSSNPAKVIGIEDRKGKIQEGYDADLVVLDEQLNVKQTWIGGEKYL
ncbi:MAG: N-acetylglucosamine-6-phosphate deacetylase [Bacteroidetes bacterium]|nr:N-acetylglucosamine-6-phosphate deacetylase [Bacteroidota bacterium]